MCKTPELQDLKRRNITGLQLVLWLWHFPAVWEPEWVRESLSVTSAHSGRRGFFPSQFSREISVSGKKRSLGIWLITPNLQDSHQSHTRKRPRDWLQGSSLISVVIPLPDDVPTGCCVLQFDTRSGLMSGYHEGESNLCLLHFLKPGLSSLTKTIKTFLK